MRRKFNTLIILSTLIIFTNLTGFSQKDNQNQYGLSFIGPGMFYNFHLSEKFYITSELSFDISYVYEFTNDIQKSNLYLSPICIKLEPRYKLNQLIFTGIQLKYGFPVNFIGEIPFDYIDDWTGFYGVIGLRKEWNKLFFEIETGAGLIHKGIRPDFAIMIDLSLGLNLSKKE